MSKNLISSLALLALCASVASADQFINRKTGDSFYGYPTNRTRKGKTQIYLQQDDKFKNQTVDLSEYAITYGSQGRRNIVIVIPVTHPDIILSGTVSKLLAATIKQAANKGPRYIILEIDSPGGRGEYMKEICTSIDETDNCPVIAFISGGKVGGAYSAAAAIAMACNAIIISPGAQIGTFAPDSSFKTNSREKNKKSENIYASRNLASYASFAASLAEKNGRAGIVAAAMLDTSIEVIEVSVDDAGGSKFINRDDRKSSDSTVRLWSKPISLQTSDPDSSSGKTSTVSAYQLTMTAKDAFDAGIAQKIASSRSELIAILGATDAKLTVTQRIVKATKKFTQNKRIMASLFINIEELSARQVELETLLDELAREMWYGSNSYEDRRLRRAEQEYIKRELERRRPNKYSRKTDPKLVGMRKGRYNRGPDDINPYLIRENMLLGELGQVLEALSVKYRQAIVLARKHPGILPTGVELRAIEKSYDVIQAKRNSGRFR